VVELSAPGRIDKGKVENVDRVSEGIDKGEDEAGDIGRISRAWSRSKAEGIVEG
jgi:hypothetical protein